MILPKRLPFTALATLISLNATTVAAAQGTLMLFANGEDLTTRGFWAPEYTRDGWELQFEHAFVTLAGIAAFQTEPPYDAETGGVPDARATVTFDALDQVTIDLTDTASDGRVSLGTLPAPVGHYNAIAWSVVPATTGDWAGHAMVLIGTATRNGETVPFTLTSADSHAYICGEYVGDERKGFVTAGGAAELELTFHLDHIFGRQDKGAADAMNQSALGFDGFSAGGTQVMELAGLHIGHVGEGHCAVSYR